MRRPLLALLLAALPAGRATAHTFDLAQQMPPHLVLSFSMAWFGIESSDPQPGGPDSTYGNWHWTSSACGLANDPATCATFADAGLQRSIASRRRPQAGIYSASGRGAESLARLDLNLSAIRRPCSSGARIDAFDPQLDSVQFTSAHPQNQQSATWDIAYRATVAYLQQADAAGLVNAVGLSIDGTVYPHFGASFGLTTAAEQQAALQSDLAEMAALAVQHPSALRLAGRPLLLIYVDTGIWPVSAWQTLLDGARSASGVDFYALGTALDGSFFTAFDALAPWVNLGLWTGATGATEEARAQAWAKSETDGLVSAVNGGSYPGRVVFAGITPGFDDYTENWGACQQREIPRDAAVLQGQFDYLLAEQAIGAWQPKGVLLETWDDWTEGSELEPDVVEGAAKLVQLRQLLGQLYGEALDPAGDQAIAARWADFGQARNCCFAGGLCADAGIPVQLACPPADAGVADAGEPRDGGGGADAGVPPDGGAGDAGRPAGGSSGGSSGGRLDAGGTAGETGSSGGSTGSGSGSGSASDGGSPVEQASGGCGCGAPGSAEAMAGGLWLLAALARRRRTQPG
ncbi:MAG: glycoside hydrolase family 71/99 protein [Myxococcales bacterium]